MGFVLVQVWPIFCCVLLGPENCEVDGGQFQLLMLKSENSEVGGRCWTWRPVALVL